MNWTTNRTDGLLNFLPRKEELEDNRLGVNEQMTEGDWNGKCYLNIIILHSLRRAVHSNDGEVLIDVAWLDGDKITM